MSYGIAQSFLRDAFPAGRSLPVSSLKVNTRRIGQRLDAETQSAGDAIVHAPRRKQDLSLVPQQEPAVAIEIDAGYIRAVPRREGVRWIAVVASKLVRPQPQCGYAHTYAGTYNPHQGAGQEVILTSAGVPSQAIVLSDGGEDVAFACRLPRPTEQVLDWFHLAMHVVQLLTAVRGLRHSDEVTKMELARRIEGAKWLLWHGRHEHCLQRLEALRRDTGWAGSRNPLGKLIRYVRSFPDRLINYGKRCSTESTCSTSSAGIRRSDGSSSGHSP